LKKYDRSGRNGYGLAAAASYIVERYYKRNF